MFKSTQGQGTIFEDPRVFGGIPLNPDNRWVLLADIIPWDLVDAEYAKSFDEPNIGSPAKPSRMALGSLIIQEKMGLTDRETVQQIRENPYLQWFIGLASYSYKAPFDASTMVWFRRRITPEMLSIVNDAIIESGGEPKDPSDQDPSDQDPRGGGKDVDQPLEEPLNHGTLILDATCIPSDIRYPTDVDLLNRSREISEALIDELHRGRVDKKKKPRTYRQKARKAYLVFARNRKPSRKVVRKATREQLGYLRRNLGHVENLLQEGLNLTRASHEKLLVIQKVYEQQLHMFESRTHIVKERIVSLHMPWVRPIVRGKSSAKVEFGAKVAISLVDGYARVDHLSWDAFNESVTLKESVERYHNTYGYYPRRVLVDKIYRTRENLGYCKKHRIELSGPRLGRPPSDPEVARAQSLAERAQAGERNAVEGKFGEGKRRYGLARILTKRQDTSETSIHLGFLVMNLAKRLRAFLCLLFKWGSSYFLEPYSFA